ncbi:aminotransferase class I/II-fold pyridoxal phosphate-dependent enzyme [Acetobacter sp. TBRC 12305]|uniref:Histidinol-phosphate aminotransferase n=1 Tax=Acetobacter garciniae TaxID=2817435 RepID=A0A939HNZ0_9PROT|nr:aminotransferase class I/II-fold pyridoxal phosphate-dependent enzyme [Acetobacter garciniae]MBO1324511.1 aminotransferase class I/II-fold pyridoxal phosphate-dependent enzyme [Acetobacter garciniae]MBX0344200.1 aminotransferase class I/II-fold pyridoxal phosphate-dependent enzyme [Acetobacter garciniae]
MSAKPASSCAPACRPEVAHLPPYNAGLSTQAVQARYGVSAISKLGSNENPYGAPSPVHAALAGLGHKVALYPEADQALKDALARHVGESPSRIVLGNGSEQIIRMIPEAYVSAGDRVVTVLPSFGLHILTAEMMGGVVDAVPVTAECEFDLQALRAAVAQPVKLLVFANPSNPVGCMMGADDLRALVAACPADCLIVVDEAYREYAETDPAYPNAQAILREQARPWIVLRTFSKAYGLAGLRIGYAITSDDAIAQTLGRVRDPFNTNIAAQLAALGALDGLEEMRRSIEKTNQARESLRAELVRLGLKVAPSYGNFLFFETEISSGDLAEALLHQGIIVKPWKERGYTHWTRVSIGLPEDNARFVAALSAILAAHPASAQPTGTGLTGAGPTGTRAPVEA